MTADLSLQERFSPHGKCFGCGPANPQGLRIRSIPVGDTPDGEVVAQWSPQKHHEAFDNILNGGIVGALLDCHSNWTAVWHLMKRDGLAEAPCSVTAEFHVKMRHPTPTRGPVTISARAVSSEGSRVTVEASIAAEGKVTATCTGTFVAVKPGHPAYGRW